MCPMIYFKFLPHFQTHVVGKVLVIFSRKSSLPGWDDTFGTLDVNLVALSTPFFATPPNTENRANNAGFYHKCGFLITALFFNFFFSFWNFKGRLWTNNSCRIFDWRRKQRRNKAHSSAQSGFPCLFGWSHTILKVKFLSKNSKSSILTNLSLRKIFWFLWPNRINFLS